MLTFCRLGKTQVMLLLPSARNIGVSLNFKLELGHMGGLECKG